MDEDDNPGEYGLEEKWGEWRAQASLPERERATEAALEKIEPSYYGPESGAHHWGEDIQKVLYLLPMEPILHKLDALWFNLETLNLQEEIARLRTLPRKEYFATEHWRHVQAAMLLIHNAICQELYHWDNHESWYFYGWETEIHVHHLSEANWGNERYEDLVLLCTEHLQEWHRNMEKYGEPRIELVLL